MFLYFIYKNFFQFFIYDSFPISTIICIIYDCLDLSLDGFSSIFHLIVDVLFLMKCPIHFFVLSRLSSILTSFRLFFDTFLYLALVLFRRFLTPFVNIILNASVFSFINFQYYPWFCFIPFFILVFSWYLCLLYLWWIVFSFQKIPV